MEDYLLSEEYLAKMDIWLKLATLEKLLTSADIDQLFLFAKYSRAFKVNWGELQPWAMIPFFFKVLLMLDGSSRIIVPSISDL